MTQHPDVLIIGGGVIGLTTAYYLALDGVRVEVVDQRDFGQEASWAGAGILPPHSPVHARTPFDQLLALSADRFPRLAAELHERTGVDNGYRRCGGLEFVGANEEAAVNEWRGEGITCEALHPPEVQRLEPALAVGPETVFHLPDMAQVRNPRHLKALLAACQDRGVCLRAGYPVHGFEQHGEQVVAVRTGAGSLRAGRYLVSAGAWSEALLQQVGWQPGIHPVRGQIALLNTGRPVFRRILLQGARYLVPRPDGRVLVGSTEENAGFVKRTTARALADLMAFAITLVPGLAEAQLERSWAGLRPGSPDGLPFLGAVPGLDNLFVAAGHFRAGIQLSPGTGLVMKELLQGRMPAISLEPFRLDRAAARSQPGTF